MVNTAGMRPQEIEAWLRRRGAPVITEKQLTDFMQVADELDRQKLIEQLEFFNRD